LDDLIRRAQELRKEILGGFKTHPEDMFFAFCVVLFDSVKDDFNSLVNGLDLTEDDKAVMLKGRLDKKVEEFWEDVEGVVEFGTLIMKEFHKEMSKKSKKVKKVKLDKPNI